MEANYVHKDSTTLVQDELVKNELNQIELQYNALKQQKFNELLKENKKLKEKVKKLSQWDINKDTRNSRQRVANAKLINENQELREILDRYENPEDMTLMMMWCTEQVKDENKKLKKKYENAVADYETTMAEKNKLKKQLEEYQQELEKADNLTQICIFKGKEESNISYRKCLNALDKKETQQKEFIKYLEDESKEIYRDGGLRQNIFRQILQKYKEIIGVSDENN